MPCRPLRLISILLFAAGCGQGDAGPPTAHLTGRVTIDGAELPDDADGTIIFRPRGGGQAQPASAPIVGGKYDAAEVPIGEIRVTFNIGRETGRMISEDGGSPFKERADLVPTGSRIGIDVTVSEDGELDFNLE